MKKKINKERNRNIQRREEKRRMVAAYCTHTK